MSTNPAAELASQVAELDRRVDALQTGVRLADIVDEVDNLDAAVGQLAARVKAVREGGYAYGPDLEERALALAKQWPQRRTSLKAQIAKQAPELEKALRPLEARLAELKRRQSQPAAARTIATQVDSTADGLESKVKAAVDTLRGSYDAYKHEVDALTDRLTALKTMLDWTAEAKFQLLSGEGVYAAVEARWDRDGKDDPKGRLFLTDQRLIFERKEEVATKKLLFITTEKELVHEVLLDVPARAVDQATASDKGLFGHEDHIDIAFSADAPVRAAHFHLNGQDNKQWVVWLGQAKSGGFDRERVVKLDPAADKSATAPTKCPSCGANFTKPLLRGQVEIVCDFCGSVARL
jgi:hypothetical protein